jgi:hypothetical protein
LTIRHGRATFIVRRAAHLKAGRYRVTVTVDRGGAVTAATRAVRIAT